MELRRHERAALDRIMSWGADPAGECDAERLEREHEAALAAMPEDVAAYGTGEGGS